MMVPVNYQDTDGRILYTDQITLPIGNYQVQANPGYVPIGYTLQGQASQLVFVNNNGVASPPSLTFIYKAPAPTATPTVKPTATPSVKPTAAPTATAPATASPTPAQTASPTPDT